MEFDQFFNFVIINMVNSLKQIMNYWKLTAKRDHNVMLGLFKIKRYPESLFYGHITLEKILKALVVKNTNVFLFSK